VTDVLSWVIGRGGLLGSHTERALVTRGDLWVAPRRFDWHLPSASDELAAAVPLFARAAGVRPWQVVWCAGVGVVASTQEVLDSERRALESVMSALALAVRSGQLSGPGAFFFASSAGGLYAGSAGPPFDEETVPAPLSPYGWSKLAQEQIVSHWATETSVPVLVGRIANLYGPGQHLDKPQGLISQLCRAHLERRPLDIYVPYDTTRDYIYAPDCAAAIVLALERVRTSGRAGNTVKVLASQRAVTVGAVIGELRRIVKRAPLVAARATEQRRFQVRDLRLRSVVETEIDQLPSTPFAVGLRATFEDLQRKLAVGDLAARS
jgi:UDP-glucose 4-epimerase